MKTLTASQYSRRQLLQRMGGTTAVAVLSPFLPALESEAATGAPARYLYWYTPVNPEKSVVDTWLPQNEGALQWRGAMSALNNMKHKMSLLRGLTNAAALDTNQTGTIGGGHEPSGATMLAGWAVNKNASAGDTPLTNRGGGFNGKSTLDQWLANNLRSQQHVDTPLKDIRIGFRNRAHQDEPFWKTISYNKGVAQYRLQTPTDLYALMFPLASQTANADNSPTLTVLDNVREGLNSIKGKLSYNDKVRFEQHLNAIDEVERQLNSSSLNCPLPESLATTEDRMDAAINTHIQLITIAFSCDMTRVAGAQWLSHLSENVSQTFRQFLPEAAPAGSDYHGTTHGSGNGTAAQKDAYLKAVAEFRAKSFTRLCQSLDGVIEANGKTLLDNSIVHWFIEVAYDHEWYDLFNVVAGGAGHFKMGQHQIVGSTQKSEAWPMNRLHTSIANGMGFNIDHFGDEKYNNGPLPTSILI